MSQTTTVDDIEVHVIRKDGKFDCRFVNMILPQDIHQIQKCIGDNYGIYRRTLIESAKRALAKEKETKNRSQGEAKAQTDKEKEQNAGSGSVQRTKPDSIMKGQNNGQSQ